MESQLSITEAISLSGFETIDFIIGIVYLILLLSLSLFISRDREGREKDTKDYFLAGNTLTWWAVGASLIAANISAEQIIGMSGGGYANGLSIAAYEIMAAIALLLIGKYFLPIMFNSKIFTIPQFLRERYNDNVGLAFSIFWILLYIFINLTSVAWLGALAIEHILGLKGILISIGDFEVSIRLVIMAFLFLISAMYSLYGGFAAIAWSDVMQVTFIIGGSLITAYFALSAIAGSNGTFLDGFNKMYSYLTTGSHTKDVHFHLVVQESLDKSAFNNVPGLAAIVGGVWLTNLCYWGFNQYITQKGLAAKSLEEARKGFMFAGFLKMLIPFCVIIPGICTYYMIEHASQDVLQMGMINSPEEAYPWFIRNFIPTGIKGLFFVALIAAIISSISSMGNSTATLFTIDIYKRFINKEASDKTLVNIGRFVTFAAFTITLIAAIPILGGFDQAFLYIQEYSALIYPGIVIVLSLGLLWKRASSTAAIWTAIITVPLGLLLKICMPDVAFQFRVGYVFMIEFVLFVVISLNSKKKIRCNCVSDIDKEAMLKWGKIFGALSIIIIIVTLYVTIAGVMLPEDSTPDNSIIAYLNDIGFQAFYFFGVFVGAASLMLISNAKDNLQNPKAMPIDLSLFTTSKGYLYGTLAVCLITALMYVYWW